LEALVAIVLSLTVFAWVLSQYFHELKAVDELELAKTEDRVFFHVV
jgi:hypothetical protein